MQLKNKDSVIDRFSGLEIKQRSYFIQFDVLNFYASITPKLFENSLEFAAVFIQISDETDNTIMQATNSFLFTDNQTWKKVYGGTFVITMGHYHGAEVCELVALFLLSQLTEVIPWPMPSVCTGTPRQIDREYVQFLKEMI